MIRFYNFSVNFATLALYESLLDYQKLGYVLDTRLHRFAYGLKLAKQLDL